MDLRLPHCWLRTVSAFMVFPRTRCISSVNLWTLNFFLTYFAFVLRSVFAISPSIIWCFVDALLFKSFAISHGLLFFFMVKNQQFWLLQRNLSTILNYSQLWAVFFYSDLKQSSLEAPMHRLLVFFVLILKLETF